MSAPSTAGPPARRFDVRSPDGTPLAVWVDGEGPPLVLVHGAMSDHSTYDPLVHELCDGMSTFAMDRRGRGASGDAAEYSITREFEDVAAVVDAVAARTGGPVALWGFSYGADCAMGAAALTDQVHHLVLYEPGLGEAYPPGCVEAVDDALARGDREAAVVAALVGIVGVSPQELDALRASPVWPVRIAVVPTLPRELRAESGWVHQPGRFEAVTAPALVLAGSESPAAQQEATRQAAAAIRHAQIRVLDGHGHLAHQTEPALVAQIIRRFCTS
jgi:pimeloyl-ACP methyl ester carboxylesterase